MLNIFKKHITINSYAICDRGRIRSDNQDNFYCNGTYRKNAEDNSTYTFSDTVKDIGLYAVADGMGGEANGADASLEAVKYLDTLKFPLKEKDFSAYLQERNKTICKWIENAAGVRMGTTFAGLYIEDGRAIIVNIGDSRVYRLSDVEFRQVSYDHTTVQSMISMGVITEEEAKVHPKRHQLTQHLGIFEDELIIEPYFNEISILMGDIFLLCSDGLSGMVEDEEIQEILSEEITVKEKAEKLFNKAINNGGKDNVTIVVVEIK